VNTFGSRIPHGVQLGAEFLDHTEYFTLFV
jgi:hypothetical protein